MKPMPTRSSRFDKSFILLFTAAIMVSMAGCGGVGLKIVKSEPATLQFQNNQFPENYRFFYTGIAKNPRAILALAEPYGVSKKAWLPLDRDAIDFPALIRNLHGQDGLDTLDEAQGRFLYSPDGKLIGNMYSFLNQVNFRLSHHTVIVF